MLRSDWEDALYLSAFSLYSLGIILLHREQEEAFHQIVEDLQQGRVELRRLGLSDMSQVVDTARRFSLDFDDAYQYTLARRDGLQLVSFDADFDRTDLQRVVPADLPRR